MSNRHLPAGQNLQGGPGGMSGVEMGNGPAPGGPRRRQPQYVPQYHQQHMAPMYPNYMSYAPQQYYGIPPQYPNGGMPSPGYMPYQTYQRSPQSMHQYVPMMGVSVPPNYPRPVQQSPNLATPYQPPPAPIPVLPQTPSSTHSSQMIPPPTSPPPQSLEQVPPQPPQLLQQSPQTETAAVVVPEPQPFRAPLPWLSMPGSPFPTRAPRVRRRRKMLPANGQNVSLPSDQQGAIIESTTLNVSHEPATSQIELADAEAQQESQAPELPTVRPKDGAEIALPVMPKPTTQVSGTIMTNGHDINGVSATNASHKDDAEATAADVQAVADSTTSHAPVKAAPVSWANLFSKPIAKDSASTNGVGGGHTNGASDAGHLSSSLGSGFSMSNSGSLAEAIRTYSVDRAGKNSLLEPRGLINTGNMCYMNSVLQVLMFCSPFYGFLDQVSKRAAHSFKSETPLIDALVMFMHEFKVLATGTSDQLRKTLKTEDFEHYGEPFTPEFVYEAIRRLSRFASMRRGHQQDAEEFLGFLLQSLDDECTHIMSKSISSEPEHPATDVVAAQNGEHPTGDWLEVGRKQKSAVTRSSGSNSSTPITKIFGGLLRSEFRVPGLKDSITTEPYQPLQLDIGSPDVRNVVDALRGLTRPERLQGDFNSPRGKDVLATKQVFIESLPPVLILHLKRFQFDAEGHGTIKIWKKVGYPLELEIPREALSRQRRQTLGDGAMPRYKLISVVYHHGKNASGGHYTVDVCRQDGREWIRMDDTVIRRVRSEDIAEGGSEGEIQDARKEQATGNTTSANRFGAMNDEDAGNEDEWKQVTTSGSGNKRWSSVVNDKPNASSKDKPAKDNIKDNKVAYLLFYQRM